MLKNKKGFTLIELVVVMALIAILSLIVVAAIQAARRAATETQRRGNIQAIEVALEARFAKCQSYTATTTACTTATPTTSGTAAFQALANSLNTQGFLSATITVDDNSKYDVESISGSAYRISALDNSNKPYYTAVR